MLKEMVEIPGIKESQYTHIENCWVNSFQYINQPGELLIEATRNAAKIALVLNSSVYVSIGNMPREVKISDAKETFSFQGIKDHITTIRNRLNFEMEYSEFFKEPVDVERINNFNRAIDQELEFGRFIYGEDFDPFADVEVEPQVKIAA